MADPTPTDPTPLRPVAPASLPDRRAAQSGLPVPLTGFVGREREIGEVAGLLRRSGVRLVTMIGPGGVGKTRLALQVAEAVADEFAGGVRFVELAPVADASLVIAAVARAWGVRETGGRSIEDGLRDFLHDRQALMVLDNLEHLLPAAAPIADLLAGCPGLTVVATSRAVLGISGEHVIAVPPLSFPTGAVLNRDQLLESEAGRLFVERAETAWSKFSVADADAAAIASICARLDGLPLAIELAAARIRHLPPAAVLARLDAPLLLLTGGPHDAPARLRTMRDAIAWSYDLLSDDEQVLFRHLGVFVGGFTLEAAEAISREPGSPGFVLDGIALLVDKSLLRRMDGAHGEPRFGMLEMVREYAQECLATRGEAPAVNARHASWCLDFAERGFSALVLGRSLEPDWLDRFEAEHGNLRAAMTWLEQNGDTVGFLRLAGVLGPFWFFRGHLAEGRYWLERALRYADEAPAGIRAMAKNSLGVLLQVLGEPVRAMALVEEAWTLWEATGDQALASQAMLIHGWMAIKEGNYARAASRLAAVGSRFRSLGAEWWVAKTRFHEGEAALGLGEAARASDLFAEALARYRVLDDPWGIASALQGLGAASCERGDHTRAASMYLEALARLKASGATEGMAGWLAGVGELAAAAKHPATAVRLFDVAAALCRALGVNFGLPERERFARSEARARGNLGEAATDAVEITGQTMNLEQVLAEATAVLAAVAVAEPPGKPEGAASGAGLTRRETDVLRLIVAGATDREIGETLAISPRTVGVHVSHVLAKLGVETRRAARTRALHERLIEEST